MPHFMAVNLKTHNFDVPTLEKAHSMGFPIVRRGFYWNACEKRKGVYNFDDYDKQMAKAKELGMTVIAVLFSHNDIYEDSGKDGFATEESRESFARFAAAAAKHFQDHDVLWEIWNEPNTMTFWGKHGKGNSPEYTRQYTALVRAVVRAMKKADPDCFVMGGSVTNYWIRSYEWTEYCFREGILDTGIDPWSVHPYGMKMPEEFAEGHTITRTLMRKYGDRLLPLLNTERGFAVKKPEGIALEGWSGGLRQRAREYQAWHFVRQVMIDQLCDVKLTVWYEWSGDTFGLADEDGSLPVCAAAKTMFKELNGYHIVDRVDGGNPLDYLVLVTDADGAQKLVAWTAPPAGETPDETVDHDVVIQLGTDVVASAVGVYGRSSELKRDVKAYRITLAGAPQYIVLPKDTKIAVRQANRGL